MRQLMLWTSMNLLEHVPKLLTYEPRIKQLWLNIETLYFLLDNGLIKCQTVCQKIQPLPQMRDNLTLRKDICWWRTSPHQLPEDCHDHLVDPFGVDVEHQNSTEYFVAVAVVVVLLWHLILYWVQHYHISRKVRIIITQNITTSFYILRHINEMHFLTSLLGHSL